MMRTAFQITLLLPLFLAVTACKPAQAEPALAPPPTPVVPDKPIYQVHRGEVVRKIEFAGRVTPVLQQALFFRTAGRVENLFVKRGDAVTAGELLADLDTDDLLFDVRRAKLNLASIELRLDLAKAEIPTRSMNDEVAIKELEVKLAEITLEQLHSAIADAQIIAPFDGQVISIGIAEGRGVEAFVPVLMLADAGELEVRADLGRTERAELVEGMPITIDLVGRPGPRIEGRIRRLPYSDGGVDFSEIEDEDRSTHIALEEMAAEADLRLGDLVHLTVVLERKGDVLWLPPQAIHTLDGHRFVMVKDGDAQRRVDVRLGLQSDDRIEIEEGLIEGQIVLGP